MVVAVSFWRDLYPKSPLPIFFLYNPTKNFFEFPIHSELIRRFWKSSKYIHYYRRSPIVHVSWIFFSVLAVYHFDFLSFPFSGSLIQPSIWSVQFFSPSLRLSNRVFLFIVASLNFKVSEEIVFIFWNIFWIVHKICLHVRTKRWKGREDSE